MNQAGAGLQCIRWTDTVFRTQADRLSYNPPILPEIPEEEVEKDVSSIHNNAGI
jgi:hypothetical protein